MGTNEGPRPSILIVEDNPGDARLIREMLRDVELDWGPFADRPAEIEVAESLSAGTAAIGDRTGLVLLDLELPDSTGIATVERMVDAAKGVPILVLTGLDDADTGMDAIERGAQDYLVKDDIDPRTLRRSIRYAIERERQQRILRRRTETLGVLTWVLRNDLRDELAIVVGRGRSLSAHVEPAGRRYLDEVVEAGENAIELTDAVGDFLAALEDEADATEAVALQPLVEEAVAATKEQYGEDACRIDGEVPATEVAGSELLGSAVADLLALVSADGGDADPVTVSTRVDGEVTVIEVTGTNDAVDPGTLDAVASDRSGTADTLADDVGSVIVEAVADLYGGELTAETVGDRTTFRLRLPVR